VPEDPAKSFKKKKNKINLFPNEAYTDKVAYLGVFLLNKIIFETYNIRGGNMTTLEQTYNIRGGNMTTLELTDEEMFAAELISRIVLRELLNKEQLMIDLVTAVAHNMNIGSFGDKQFKPEDTDNWIQYLDSIRNLIDKLDPEYRKSCDELGDSHYKLPEEEK